MINKYTKYYLTFLLFILSIGFGTTYNVSGVVQMEDQPSEGGSHDGVKVRFLDLSNNLTPEDSTVTSESGAYSINVSPGYYLVEWTKVGYVPMELGGLALAENTVLDTIVMIPGEILEVSGDLATSTWTTSFVYYVTDDITVPAGETLTIDPGVRVKFYSGTGLTVNGTLVANGVESSPVRFSSKEPTPLPGDWDNIVLNGEDNVLSYVYYDYATDGLTGSNAHNTTIDHLKMEGTLALSASGITFMDSENLTISNSIITTSGSNGIYSNNSLGSKIEGNTISGSYDNGAIYMDNCDGCEFKNNVIKSNPEHGIYANSSDDVLFENNEIEAGTYGIRAEHGTNHNYLSNNITDFDHMGIRFENTRNCTLLSNRLTSIKEGGPDLYGMYNHSNWGDKDDTTFTVNEHYLERNYVELYSPSGYARGIYVHNSIILKDTVKCYGERDVNGIYANSSLISHCYLEIWDRYSWRESYAIQSYYNSRRSLIKSNTTFISAESKGIWADQAKIDSNYIGEPTISSPYMDPYNNQNDWAIGHGNYNIITNNTLENLAHGIYADDRTDNIIKNNTMSVRYWGIYANNASGTHVYSNNDITKTNNDWFVYVTNTEDVKIDSNRFIGLGSDFNSRGIYVYNTGADISRNTVVVPGRALHIENQAGSSVKNNTLVSTNEGDYGMYITNLSTPSLVNNIVDGFQTGIYAESSVPNYNNTPMAQNLFNNIVNDNFAGSNLPVLIGNMVDQNANGYTSDIYGNIMADPQYVDSENYNYNLLSSSPAINAGESSTLDPDGSVSDIGAHYYHIYVVMDHLSLNNTNDTDGPYRVEAEISSPAGATLTGQLYYSVDGGDYSSVDMTPANNDTFYADIPGQGLNSVVSYYISASDGENTATLPYDIASGGYSFFVSLFDQFANMGGQAQANGDIELSWGTPIPITGTLSSLNLYRSLSNNVLIDDSNLYQTFEPSVTSFTDVETSEGVIYYYKLTGILDDGVEALVSAEVDIMSDDATKVLCTGNVELSDIVEGDDYSGVKVLFSKVSPAAISDSLVTDTDGVINIVMQTGIYNIYFSKDGYQPYMMGNVFLSENVDLDTTVLTPGGSLVLSGEVSDTLYNYNVHYVDGDVVVNVGDSLTIQPGTLIKFRGDFKFEVYGYISAVGTEADPIIFTSGMPSILEGDWKHIYLENAHNSEFKSCDFSFSENGIFINNSDSIEISYCTFGRFLNDAIAISDLNHNNNENLTISNNRISDVRRGVEIDNARNSEFNFNEIEASDIGIYCRDCDSTTFNNNEIYPPLSSFMSHGLWAEYSDMSEFSNNNLLGSNSHSIYFRNSSGGQALNNVIADTNKQGEANVNGGTWAIYHWEGNSENITMVKNNVIHQERRNGWSSNAEGIHARYAEISDNNIRLRANRSTSGINAEYSLVESNYIFAFSDGSNCNSINAGYYSLVQNNIVYAFGDQRGFTGGYRSKIQNNTFYATYSGESPFHTEQGQVNYTNWNWAVRAEAEACTLLFNQFYDFQHGIYVDGRDAVVKNNTFRIHSSEGFDLAYGNNSVVHYNNIIMNGDDNYGMRIREGNISNVYRNTIVSNSESRTGDGIRIEGNSHPNLNSNLIYGFDTGIEANSDVYTMKFNLTNNVNSHLIGEGLPDQAGEMATVNLNGDPADIYGNIRMNPNFVNLDSSNALSGLSGAIDAGDVDSLDLDASIVDIGAEFYNFGYAPYSIQIDSTGEGSVHISWDIIETDSLEGFQSYYRLSEDEDWISGSQSTEQNISISGLENNLSHEFSISALYTQSESNQSKYIESVPGLAIMDLSPKFILSSFQSGEESIVSFDISNSGSKNLNFQERTPIDLGSVTYTKENYADQNDPDNVDQITSNVWIARNNNQGLYNRITDTGYGNGPSGTLWKWGPTNTDLSGDYTSWRSALDQSGCGRARYALDGECNGGPSIMSLHLLEDDLYFDVRFTWWQCCSQGGGFSYERTHLASLGTSIYGDAPIYSIEPGQSLTLTDTSTYSSEGVYTKSVLFPSNDQENPVDTLFILNLVGPQSDIEAQHFTPVDTTENVYYYLVESGDVDGMPLETGDEIALYDGELCVGAGYFNGVLPFVVQCFGSTEDGQEGFTEGSPISVKLWDHGLSRLADATGNLNFGSGDFSSGEFGKFSINASVYFGQQIVVQGGMFNLVSSYLYPEQLSADFIFGGLDNLQIVYQDNGLAYIPEFGINTLGDFNMTEGYHIFVSGDDQVLNLSGLTIDPSEWEIDLMPNQFNSIPYLHNGAMDAELAMEAIGNVVEIVQDDAGNAWIPEFDATIGNLIPGKGYQVFTNVDTLVPFTYAPYQAPVARLADASPKTPVSFYSYLKTGFPYAIVLESALIDGYSLKNEDEVAVFDGELCVGALVWNEDNVNVLTAWKGDESLGLSGYTKGSPMSFKVYKKQFKESVDVTFTSSSSSEGFFESSSYSTLSILGNPGLIPEDFALHQNYPNPFNPTTHIDYHVAENANVTMTIYNLMGQEIVRLLSNQTHDPGKYNIIWNATNNLGENVSAGVYLIHMSSKGFSKTRKMVLLK